MARASVVIVDYGLGNLFSVERAVRHLGAEAVISSDPVALETADRVILPGVGAFGDGMRNLRKRGLIAPLLAYAGSGRPLLGICLGMQLLMSESEEFGLHQGIGLVTGKVVRLRSPTSEDRFRVPHIGWNALHSHWKIQTATPWQGTLLQYLEQGTFMYFLHSYVVVPENPSVCLAVTRQGRDTFCSVLRHGNTSGVQFHPERSGEDGLRLFRAFLSQIIGSTAGAKGGGEHDGQDAQHVRSAA